MSSIRKTIAVLPGDGIGPEVTRAAVHLLQDCAAAHRPHFRIPRTSLRRVTPSTHSALHYRHPRSRNAAKPMRFCSAPSAAPSGRLFHSGLAPRRACWVCGSNSAFTSISAQFLCTLRCEVFPRCARSGWPIAISKSSASWQVIFISESTIGVGGGKFRAPATRPITPASEVERVARYAFERAASRKHHVTSVDKANVLATSNSPAKPSAPWRAKYPDVTLDHLYVDNAAMQILLRPAQFDVILAGNLFGDILSDEAAALAGSIGLIPSMSRGRRINPPRCTSRFTGRRHRSRERTSRPRSARSFPRR